MRRAGRIAVVTFARVVLLLSALPFGGIGVAFLVAPEALAARVGLALDGGGTSFADLRAVYGGLQLSCALALGAAARNPAWVAPGLGLQVLLYGGLFLARLYSYAVSGLPDGLGYALHAGEAVGVLAGVVAILRLRHGGRS